MKKLFFCFLFLCGCLKGQAQFFKDNFYYEGEIGGIVSFAFTDNEGKMHPITMGGLNFRGGIGIHDKNDIVFVGIHSGIDGNWRHSTGILPVYLNSRVGIPLGEASRIYLGFGCGKSYQIGHENLHGILKKYTLAYSDKMDDGDRVGVFVEINNFGFNFPDDNNPAITLNLGITCTFL